MADYHTLEQWLAAERPVDEMRKAVHEAYLDWREQTGLHPNSELDVPYQALHDRAKRFPEMAVNRIMALMIQSLGLQIPIKYEVTSERRDPDTGPADDGTAVDLRCPEGDSGSAEERPSGG